MKNVINNFLYAYHFDLHRTYDLYCCDLYLCLCRDAYRYCLCHVAYNPDRDHFLKIPQNFFPIQNTLLNNYFNVHIFLKNGCLPFTSVISVVTISIISPISSGKISPLISIIHPTSTIIVTSVIPISGERLHHSWLRWSIHCRRKSKGIRMIGEG